MAKEIELPLDILSSIAGGKNALTAMMGVCHSWKQGFENSVSRIKVPRAGPLLPCNGKLADHFPWLTSLDIGDSLMNEVSLGDSLLGLKHLTTLALQPKDIPITKETLRQTLGWQMTGAGLSSLQGLPLAKLVLRDCKHLRDANLRHLQKLHRISLDLGNCERVSGAGVENLSTMPLTDLWLDRLSLLRGSDLQHLSGLPLARLFLNDSAVWVDSNMKHLRGLPLTHLSLATNRWSTSPELTDAALAWLVGWHAPRAPGPVGLQIHIWWKEGPDAVCQGTQMSRFTRVHSFPQRNVT